ncbi:MAG: hypothetical protein ABI222_04775 [Opitutaceae bacterium]
MRHLRAFWTSLSLAIVCVVAFAISYYALAEGKRNETTEHGALWLFGSPLLVGCAAIAAFYLVIDDAQKKKIWYAIGGGVAVSGVYFYFLMFVVLNTLGS